MYIYTTMAVELWYYLTVVMENVGRVEKAMTKYMKDMYVYRNITKAGYVFELSVYKENLYRCVGCKRHGKSHYITKINDTVVTSKKHSEDDHVCEPLPVEGMLC